MGNIYLVGFMGTGKTATGKVLSKSLKRAFFDMDELIEEREKMTIPDIFEKKGEPYFRALEKEVVKELAKKNDLVIACGGGAFVDPENIENMKASGKVIWLTSSPEMILDRTKKFTHRPLLNVKDPLVRIKDLLAKREPFYSQAHCVIDCDKLSVEQSAEAVLRCLDEV
ncbi:MAG TPA: shikimate kinase [Candidatus Omnitrophota bacterium]|nr:shikimate kinase [Candidatus Omnitrophota bacterium]